jgi:hypothetical protein
VLCDYVKTQSNILVFAGAKMAIDDQPNDAGMYGMSIVSSNPKDVDVPAFKEHFTPDVVYVAEGSNSATRKRFNIDYADTTPARKYIAGTLGVPGGAFAGSNYDEVLSPTGEVAAVHSTYVAGENMSNTWVLTEVPSFIAFNPTTEHPGLALADARHTAFRSLVHSLSEATPAERKAQLGELVDSLTVLTGDERDAKVAALAAMDPQSAELRNAVTGMARHLATLDPASKEYAEQSGKLAEAYFRQVSPALIGISEEAAQTAPARGPIEVFPRPTAFALQGHMARDAVFGKQFFFGGDSVANAHPKASAGMVLATGPYIEAFKEALTDLAMGVPREKAMRAYNTKAREIGIVWGKQTISQFYPWGDHAKFENDGVVKFAEYPALFEKAVRQWLKDAPGSASPLERLESLIAEQSVAHAPVGDSLEPAKAA